MRAEAVARAFHEAYERLAPSFGYETRKETRAFDPTTPNGRLMIAVAAEVLAYMDERPHEAGDREAMDEFEKELESLVNRTSRENSSNTPDFILAGFLRACLMAWNAGVRRRAMWYGRMDKPGEIGKETT
jgi:hypothetical protein